MFSNYYQIGESIELFNSQDRTLLSKWGFIGKCSKVYDPKLRTYEMVLSIGNLSKMEIPKTSKIKTLSLFQSFIVFQLYLFTSKQLTIEIAISDSTNAKRRLIFSTNNSDLVINQLYIVEFLFLNSLLDVGLISVLIFYLLCLNAIKI